MVRRELLRHHVVLVETDVAAPSPSGATVNGTVSCPGGRRRRSGRPTSIRNSPPGRRCAAALAKTVDLTVLRRHVADGVEHQDRPGRTRPRRESTVMSPIVTAIVSPPGLLADPRRHRLARARSRTPVAARAQRSSDPPGPDGELQHGSVTGELLEHVHGAPTPSRVRWRRQGRRRWRPRSPGTSRRQGRPTYESPWTTVSLRLDLDLPGPLEVLHVRLEVPGHVEAPSLASHCSCRPSMIARVR